MDKLTQNFWNKIEQYYGIRYNENKNKSLLEIAACRAATLGFDSVDLYLNLFVSGKLNDDEYRFWATQLTVNETYFFRDEGQWEAIREKIIPEIIRAKAATKELRALCLGASSGEEPYTLAMIIQFYFKGLPGWNVSIDATDIKEELLTKAREGKYTERSIRGIPREIADRYLRGGLNSYSITDDIRKMVNFLYHNILDLPNGLPSTRYDIIICRNVIIYFSKEIAIRTLTQMVPLLAPEGHLVLGHSEGHLTNALEVIPVFTNSSVLYKKSKIEKTSMQKEFEPWRGFRNALKYSRSFENEEYAITEKPKAKDVLPEFSTQFPDTFVQQAQAYIEKHEYENAKRLLDRAIKQLPFFTPAHYMLGILYQAMDQKEKALKQFERVIYLDPNHILAYFQCAMLYHQRGNKTAAGKYYSNILALTQNFDKGYVIDDHTELTIGFIQMMCKNFATQENIFSQIN